MWWRAYAYMRPNAPFPDQADDYRRRLVTALQETWIAYVPAVDRGLEPETTGSSAPITG